MAFIEIPEVPVLRGERAINALNDYIKEFEERKDKELTTRQTKTLIEFAEGLIAAIEAETSSKASGTDSAVRSDFINNLKKIFASPRYH